jgi:glycosyltransferase involved in cell wall biosynthesis
MKTSAKWFLFGRRADLERIRFSPEFGEIVPHDYGGYTLSELFSFKKPLTDLGADLFFSPHYTLPFRLPCPSVVTIHDLIHLRRPVKFGIFGRKYAKFVMSRACRNSSVVLTDSNHSKNDISAAFPKKSGKLRVVNPGVNRDVFKVYPQEEVDRFRKETHLPEKFVLYTGALKRHKNPKALIEIVNNLKFPMVIASNDRQIYERDLVPSAKYKDMLRLIDSISAENMVLLYNSARVFVFPSFYEGFGLPPLEAMACGLPVVCSNATSLPEVIGDSALAFSPDNPADMLAKVDECWNDERTRSRLRESGLERARIFDWNVAATEIFGIFKEVCGN